MMPGLSLVAIAIGAILKFAVEARVGGIDVGTVGVILMIVGGVAFVVWLGFAVADSESVDRPT